MQFILIQKKIDENSTTIPNSLHGIMHLTREIMFENFKKIMYC